MRRALLLVAAVLLPLAVAAVWLVVGVDPNTVKPAIAEAVLRATGRTLTLAGPLRLSVAWPPAVTAEDVALANAPGSSRPAMLTVPRLRIQFSLLPLLHHELVIDRLTLEHPDLLLETNAAGAPNWIFAKPLATPAPAPALPLEPQGGKRFAVALRDMSRTDGTLTWRDGASGRSVTVALPHASCRCDPTQALAIDGQLAERSLAAQFAWRTAPPGSAVGSHLTLDGTLAGEKLSITADLAGSVAGDTPVILDLAASAGASSLSVKGSVGRPLAASTLDLAVTAQIADAAALEGLLGQKLPAPLRLAVRVTGNPRGDVALHGLRLDGAAGNVTGDLAIARTPVPSLRGMLAATRLDLDALRAALARPAPAAPATPVPPAPPMDKQRRLIPDTSLPWEALRHGAVDLQLGVADLTDGGIVVRGLAAHVVLNDGRLTIEPLGAQLAGGAMQGALTIDASSPIPAVALRLHAPGLAVQTLLAVLRLPALLRGPIEVLADLHASGATPRALAASLTGTLGLAMDGGELDEAAAQGAFGGLARSASLPAELLAGSGSSALHCLALRMAFTDGRGTLQTLLLDTARAHVEGDGSVDLADETLALHLRPLARLGLAGVAVPLRVSGTLAFPRGQIDAGAVAGALAGGGGFRAVLGLLSDAATREACGPQLALARGEPPPPPERATNPGAIPGDLLKKLFR